MPLESEAWLQGLFATGPIALIHREASDRVDHWANQPHPLYPALWRQWCAAISESFKRGKTFRPLDWKSPAAVNSLMKVVFHLTAQTWPEDAMAREVSVALGLHSKSIEAKRRTIESCLMSLFGRETSLESLGIALTHSTAQVSGGSHIHFEAGSVQSIDKLRDTCSLSLSDLIRAVRITTPARRLLTVENSKTTLRRLSLCNRDGDTLLAACTFPTKALIRFIELLPRDIEIYHFGDTDPAGFDILRKLRVSIPDRKVIPFLMCRRECPTPKPLTDYDRSIIPRLLREPILADVWPQLRKTLESGDKGDFEQETLSLPDLDHWPFYSLARDHLQIDSAESPNQSA